MDRSIYIAEICSRLGEGAPIAYRDVPLDSGQPKVADCHQNVDAWVATHPDSRAVRGWVTLYGDGHSLMMVTAHSVVEGPDGSLFDITPLENEEARQGMRFMRHIGVSVVR